MKVFRTFGICMLLILCLTAPAYADELFLIESEESNVSESDYSSNTADGDGGGSVDDTEVGKDDSVSSPDDPVPDQEVDNEPGSSADAVEGEESPLPDEDGVSGDSAEPGSEDNLDSGADVDGDPVDGTITSAGDALAGIYNLLAESELFSVDDNAYPETAPLQAGCYIQADTSELGTVMIYIPFSFQEKSLTFDRSGNLVNISGSTISGLVYRGSTSYQFRISSFSTPQYRQSSSSSYSWENLNVNHVISTNAQILDDGHEVPLYPSERMVQLIVVFLLGVVVCRLFMMRS